MGSLSVPILGSLGTRSEAAAAAGGEKEQGRDADMSRPMNVWPTQSRQPSLGQDLALSSPHILFDPFSPRSWRHFRAASSIFGRWSRAGVACFIVGMFI